MIANKQWTVIDAPILIWIGAGQILCKMAWNPKSGD
jgi:hypothetical protein